MLKWTGFLVSLVLTLWYAFEHSYLNLGCNAVDDMRSIDRSSGKAFSTKVIAILSVISNLFELFFFIIIIGELLRHERMHNSICHSNDTNSTGFIARKQKNAITSWGHFVSWLIECVVFGTCHWITNSGQSSTGPLSRFFLMMLPSINYAVFPTAQVFTSPQLRNHVFSPPFLPTCSCKCFTCTRSEDPEEDAPALEMNVIQNGNILHI